MRLIGAASAVFGLALSFAISQPTIAQPPDERAIFRFDTFGDEQLENIEVAVKGIAQDRSFL
jgi:hypothetical protein